MKLLSLILPLMLVLTAPVLAQDSDTGEPPPPPVEGGADPNAPVDPNAPLIVGKEKFARTAVQASQVRVLRNLLRQQPTRVEAVVVRNGGARRSRSTRHPCLLRDTTKGATRWCASTSLTTPRPERERSHARGRRPFYIYGTRPIPGSSAPYLARLPLRQGPRGHPVARRRHITQLWRCSSAGRLTSSPRRRRATASYRSTQSSRP